MTRRLWKCPKCGHRFVTKNLWHSCVRVPLRTHFEGKPPAVRAAYRAWARAARACGPVTIYAQKSRIIFQARVRFGGAVVKKDWVEGRLWLRRRVDHPRLTRTEDYGRLGFGPCFRIEKPDDVDAELSALMREAYASAVSGG